MGHKNSNSHLILIFVSFFFLLNCKSDKKNNESTTNNNAPHSTKVESKKKESSDSTIDSTSIKKTPNELDSVSGAATNQPPVENKTKPDLPKKEVKDQKPSKPKKKKPKKVIPSKKPKIQFQELVWDFGEIIEGDIVEKKFKFTNAGNAPLEIIATSATCGCTRPSFPLLKIQPGDSNEIGVTYNSVGKDGEQTPEVTIESNTYPKITTLKLHGFVKPKPKEEEKTDSTSVKY